MPGTSSAKTRFALLPGNDELELVSHDSQDDAAIFCARAAAVIANPS